ncbi:MAG TPA: DUF1345 domain-containing protein [Rhizomicrobium sp.]|nr:DUF1345 domain-containing protein [Rhizomicrobium sp.]
MKRLQNHWRHHWRFYGPALLGAVVYVVLAGQGFPLRVLAAGDGSFALYLLLMAIVAAQTTAKDLKQRAALEDEGMVIVLLVALAIIVLSSIAIFTVLRQKHSPIALTLALAGVPLGWFTLHTLVAFHYAYIFYGKKGAQKEGGLDFPQTEEPGVWEFLYYSFTIGTTAQTSDTNVTSTRVRRATLMHSVLSFFYNTAIIAMAINAVVSIAS